MTRREFVQAASAGPLLAWHAPGAEDWQPFDRAMRWAQLTLVENDPGRYDPQFWLDYFRRIRADAACLSAGGCVAYYPTKVPFHHRSAWLGDRDAFGELFEGCRKLGMIVLARTDPHATYQDVFEAHPDWIAVDAQGQKRRHWASPEMWVTCALGPYNFEFMTEVTREIASLYKVDGIFSNRWAGSGMCYCEHCQKNFRAFSGMDLPRTNNPRDPVRRAYLQWREQRLFELWRLWDSEIRKVNPQARFIANAGGGALSDLDMKTIGELAPTLFADRQARRGLAPVWEAGKNGKEYRATMGRKPIGGIFSVGLEEPYRWKDSVQAPAEIRLWVADGVANGLRPWFTKFAGVLHDPRWLKTVEEIYTRYASWERYLRNEEPLARVAVVYSQQTATYYGGAQARQRVEDHTLGVYQALIEARVPFEMVHDGLLAPERIRRFKLLILPNIAALSDSQCDQLRQYVRQGGSLLATLETSLYDEWGTVRKNFGLADLFGADFKTPRQGPMQNSYLRLEHATRHPLLAGLEDAPRIINGVYRVGVAAREEFPDPPVTLIPSYPDLPMEKVYPRVERTNIPEVYLRQLGGSRVVYFPWDIDRVFWEVMCVDHGRLLRNAIAWAANEEPPVTVTGPGVLDVTIWRQANSLTVHLVNLSNPMFMKGPARELLPAPAQQVRLRLPQGLRARRVQLLNAGVEPKVRQQGDSISLTVPPFLDHEVIAVDL
ncbi:MAG: beta-galactosidase trimerization domain-containing protein [Bryobacteraceae bacterium]|nr:beta-galactosidase trimerization domain-containing protein [Bryobacteraceae bacterium]